MYRDILERSRKASEERQRTLDLLAALEHHVKDEIDPARVLAMRKDLNARLKECEIDMDRVLSVMYGALQDGRGGVAALMGEKHADAVAIHYVLGDSLKETARICGISVASVKKYIAQVCAKVDELGEMSFVI